LTGLNLPVTISVVDTIFTDIVVLLKVYMDEIAEEPKDLLPLTPAVFHILLALAGGEKHGYAIMLDVEDLSDSQVKMGPGTLYGSIKRMLEAGLIEESDDRPDPELDDERRRYYRLTGMGKRVLRVEAERLAELVAQAQARRVLEPAAR
jgi:DNA-binding PadR family transcriptional regulator